MYLILGKGRGPKIWEREHHCTVHNLTFDALHVHSLVYTCRVLRGSKNLGNHPSIEVKWALTQRHPVSIAQHYETSHVNNSRHWTNMINTIKRPSMNPMCNISAQPMPTQAEPICTTLHLSVTGLKFRLDNNARLIMGYTLSVTWAYLLVI